MTNRIPRNRRLTVSQIKSELDAGAVPLQDSPFVGPIGTVFHRVAERVYRQIQTDDELLRSILSAEEAEACQPLLELIYHKILEEEKFASLSEDSQEALWKAIKEFSRKLGSLINSEKAEQDFHRVRSSILLGCEQDLCWVLDLDGTEIEIVGRLDMIVRDPRYDVPVLLDFKLCGVKKDLANLFQVMLYAIMLNRSDSVKCAAEIVNLYPVRQPFSVSWEQIERFETALTAFVHKIAFEKLPGIPPPPRWQPGPSDDLEQTSDHSESARSGFRTCTQAGSNHQSAVTDTDEMANLIQLLEEFNLRVEPLGVDKGPRVIRLNIKTTGSTRVASVEQLTKDIQVRLSTTPIVMVGSGRISVEMPRESKETVRLEPMLGSEVDRRKQARFPIGVGIGWDQTWADLSDHSTCQWLISGSTGSGKSEFLRCVITALGYRSNERKIVFSLIDPKMGVTFKPFEGWPSIKHLATTPEESIQVLDELCLEMDHRYAGLEAIGADHLQQWAEQSQEAPPRWVVIFDEYAEFMAQTKFRQAIGLAMTRLGQKGRASGIHVFLATQHPSAEVCPTILRNNLVARVAFKAADRTQSLVVLDQTGAENLLGEGDLLFKGATGCLRLQAPYVPRADIKRLLRI